MGGTGAGCEFPYGSGGAPGTLSIGVDVFEGPKFNDKLRSSSYFRYYAILFV